MVARDRNADGNGTTGTGGLEQRVYALQDANWNTTAIIAATGVPGVSAGNVINRFAYTPYGEVQTLTASWATPAAGSAPAVPWAHLFQGLKFTDVTGLAYVRHRDYSATLGRFIEMDPIGFSAGDNNWYRFVANGPTGKTDPSGLCDPIISIGIGIGIIILASGCGRPPAPPPPPAAPMRPPELPNPREEYCVYQVKNAPPDCVSAKGWRLTIGDVICTSCAKETCVDYRAFVRIPQFSNCLVTLQLVPGGCGTCEPTDPTNNHGYFLFHGVIVT